MNRRDKKVLPQEGMVCHKEFMEIKSPAEKVVLYTLLAILVVLGVVYSFATYAFVATLIERYL